jgi:uncharacterized protein
MLRTMESGVKAPRGRRRVGLVNCPLCREPLIVAEREGIELDWCPSCRGLWFDAGELELLAEKAGRVLPSGAVAAPDEKDPAGTARSCPRCDRKLETASLGSELKVTLDRCGAGHGLWFDHGELGSLMARLPVTPGSHPEAVLRFLGEVLVPGSAADESSSGSDGASRAEVKR